MVSVGVRASQPWCLDASCTAGPVCHELSGQPTGRPACGAATAGCVEQQRPGSGSGWGRVSDGDGAAYSAGASAGVSAAGRSTTLSGWPRPDGAAAAGRWP